ncbi:MAG: YceI family protein [Flavobacteriaceae bacterium]
MKKIAFLLLALTYCGIANAQNYKTTKGEIEFNASTPLEDIHAVNKVVNAILKPDNGDFASVLLMKDFKFRRSLMQEHFNENYVESEKYPKAYFTGKIKDFNSEGLSSSPKEFAVDGKLTIHGVTKAFSTKAKLSKGSGGIKLVTNFIVKPEEFKIEVPKLLFKKIAQEVKVDVAFQMAEQ